MNKNKLIFFTVILSTVIFLPAVVFSSPSSKILSSKNAVVRGTFLTQNSQPLPPNLIKLIKDKEFDQIDGLLDLSRDARSALHDNLPDRHIKPLLIDLNGNNPRQLASSIKDQTQRIKEILSDTIMNRSVEQAIQRIALFHNNFQMTRPESISMRGEKITLFQQADSHFLDLRVSVFQLRDTLNDQVLQKLNSINGEIPNADLSEAIDNIKFTIETTEKIEDAINKRLDPFMNAYIATLSSVPEQQVTSGLEGDLTGDGKVDIFDLVTVAKNFGKKIQ